MAMPIAHALVGASFAVAFWPEPARAGLRRALIAGAVLGVCPDFDCLINLVRIFGQGWHHGFTHSVAFALVMGAAASGVLGLRGWRGALACGLAVLSHPVLDYLVTESHGIALLWPVTDQRFSLEDGRLGYYRLAGFAQWGTWVGYLRLSVIDLLMFGPVLAAAVLLRRRPAP